MHINAYKINITVIIILLTSRYTQIKIYDVMTVTK